MSCKHDKTPHDGRLQTCCCGLIPRVSFKHCMHWTVRPVPMPSPLPSIHWALLFLGILPLWGGKPVPWHCRQLKAMNQLGWLACKCMQIWSKSNTGWSSFEGLVWHSSEKWGTQIIYQQHYICSVLPSRVFPSGEESLAKWNPKKSTVTSYLDLKV